MTVKRDPLAFRKGYGPQSRQREDMVETLRRSNARRTVPHVDHRLCHESIRCSLCAAKRQRRADSESAVQREVRLALSSIGCVVWRNNVGVDSTRGVRYGLQVGSGDLIGIAPGGRFLSVECKRRTGGRVSDQQRLWLELVRARGGIAIVARSGDEAVTLVTAAMRPQLPAAAQCSWCGQWPCECVGG